VTSRRKFLASLSALAAADIARAQPRLDIPRIGLLFAAAPPAVAARIDALRTGLAALGYVEGARFVFEPRYAYGDLARLPVLAKELARMPVDVIVTGGSSATRPALDATATIPIVMAQDNDPVGARVVASLARPGGNVTGLSTLVPELSAKQLALIGELVPGVARIALFGDSGEAGNAQSVAEAERAAARLNVEVQYLDLRKIGDPAQLFAAATRGRAGAVLVLASGYLFARQDEVVALALKARLPALYAHPEFVGRGGLATYGVNVLGLFRQTAGYVVKILNGAKPADLPVEQPTKFELVINLKAAKALGITIPQSLLLRADEVIQ
jgi:putative tryptophan/tyrosine transport system substrate-binding protein